MHSLFCYENLTFQLQYNNLFSNSFSSTFNQIIHALLRIKFSKVQVSIFVISLTIDKFSIVFLFSSFRIFVLMRKIRLFVFVLKLCVNIRFMRTMTSLFSYTNWFLRTKKRVDSALFELLISSVQRRYRWNRIYIRILLA